MRQRYLIFECMDVASLGNPEKKTLCNYSIRFIEFFLLKFEVLLESINEAVTRKHASD